MSTSSSRVVAREAKDDVNLRVFDMNFEYLCFFFSLLYLMSTFLCSVLIPIVHCFIDTYFLVSNGIVECGRADKGVAMKSKFGGSEQSRGFEPWWS